ncbi:MAG: 3-deoxy-manno-octulosonate cytidylyltransferase [Chlorobiaceae bacterium]|nr:3-deoxy-manno-octulosonate cytidylyltransferase [Chlorobiaceae bacterium]
MNVVIVIPARLSSSRLKEKMLADLEGEPLIVRTWQQAMKSRLAKRVVVATDSERIFAVLRDAGAEVVMTSPDLTCGTDRIAEAAEQVGGDVFVNLQGDEPLIDPATIDLAIAPFFEDDSTPDCTTLVFPLKPDERHIIDDPHVVKAVLDAKGHALYFSRCPIPYRREMLSDTRYYRHIGLYAFRADVLKAFVALPPSMLERAESLEQLRLLENGYRIRCIETTTDTPGVNTEEELEEVRRLFRVRYGR